MVVSSRAVACSINVAPPPCPIEARSARTSRCWSLLVAALVGSAPLTLAGCEDDCSFDDVDVAGHDQNPDGVPYPTGPFGATPRQGGVPGDIIPNFVFRGYVDGNTSTELQTVSLADYFDPSGSRNLVLHLMVAAMWCPVCTQQTGDMVAAQAALRSEGAVVVQALIMGPDPDTPVNQCDLVEWIEERSTNFPVVLDVDARRISSITAINAIPWNALVDTRTMEVLQAGEGAPVDYAAYVRTALDWVAAHPL